MQFLLLPTAFYLWDNVPRHYHVSFNIKIIKEEIFQKHLYPSHSLFLKKWSELQAEVLVHYRVLVISMQISFKIELV